MSDDERMARYRQALKDGKVKPDKVSEEWAFQRAWNEGIEFAERQLDKVFGKPE